MVAPATHAPPPRSLAHILFRPWPLAAWLPMGLAAIALLLLAADPVRSLSVDWKDPDAGQGLLLVPVGLWLAWRSGVRANTKAQPGWGALLLVGGILLRALGALAAENYTQRISIAIICVGLVVFCFGWTQVRHWWLPITLVVLAIPLPALIINKLAIPLQFKASAMGTTLIKWRHIPVTLNGNVITILPGANFGGMRLFVAEACSGLRSISALLALGVLLGGMYLATMPARVFVVLCAVPVAVFVNGIRIFLTAFLSYYVDPALAKGEAHETTGWLLFLSSFALLAGISTLVRMVERRVSSAEVTGA